MRAKKRTIGGFLMAGLSFASSAIMFTQENWEEMWVALAFTTAFGVGFLIYAKSNLTETKRLAKEKEKRKGKK